MRIDYSTTQPTEQVRVYKAILKWTRKDVITKKENTYRQEYVIMATNPKDAKNIASNHIHPTIFPKNNYDIEIQIKDLGIPHTSTTFYTSPIIPDTYKRIIPEDADAPVDPSIENDKKLRDKIKKLQSDLKSEKQKHLKHLKKTNQMQQTIAQLISEKDKLQEQVDNPKHTLKTLEDLRSLAICFGILFQQTDIEKGITNEEMTKLSSQTVQIMSKAFENKWPDPLEYYLYSQECYENQTEPINVFEYYKDQINKQQTSDTTENKNEDEP
jgi:hypothetical protein